MDASYITASASSAEAFKTATLLKTLNVNSLITGEVGVGKKSLAKYILPDAVLIDASSMDELLTALQSLNEVIITNLENSPNVNKILDYISSNNIRIIATAKSSYYNESVDKIFGIKFDIPPLSQRQEDIKELIQRFTKEAKNIFGIEYSFNKKNFKPDISSNANSLRRQVMMSYLFQDIQENELIDIIESYLVDKLGSKNDYKNYLHLYEVPLIKAGLMRFKSQLQLSDKLGLNRNTLRKKISDNKQYL